MSLSSFRPIVTSLLEVDWYKFTMSRFIWKHHRDVHVRFAFKNRHAAKVNLHDFISRGALLREIDEVRQLRFTDAEIAFLRESPHIPKGFFPEEYLQALKSITLPPVEVIPVKDGYRIQTDGPWWIVSFWETIIMNIVNELYFRVQTRIGLKSVEEVWSEGTVRLMKKVETLKAYPRIKFAPFGLRRGYSVRWSRHSEGILCKELPSQITGISNVRSAMENGKRPSGTCAHEMYMVTAAIAGTISDEALRAAPMAFTRAWFEEYGPQWSVAIPDTFGSESYFDDMPHDLAVGINAWKIDSGDPFERGERTVRFFRDQHGIDPLTKTDIFCDGLDTDMMLKLHGHFADKVGVALGPGTNMSNDVGFTPISIVVKASEVLVNGVWVPTVKLSDNLEKASGPAEEVARYARVFEYHNTFKEVCKV